MEPKKKTNRPAKLRGWSSESMVEAMKAVKEGQFGAALEYGVPKRTLKIHGTNMGPTPYLTYEEEKELVRFILDCSRMDYGKTRGELLRIVGETMKKKGRLLVGSSASQGWWSQFKERWPELSLRKGDAFSLHESPPLQSSSSVLATAPISKFLVYPTPVKKTKVSPTVNKCARILTSTESLQLLDEKEKKKKEDAEEKARKKQEREVKKKARVEEKKTKEEARKRKAEERAAMRAEQTEKKKTTTKKMKITNIAAPTKVHSKRRELRGGAAYQESSKDMFCVCLGLWKDDMDKETGCLMPGREWIQCSDEECGVWSHVECLEEEAGYFHARFVRMCFP